MATDVNGTFAIALVETVIPALLQEVISHLINFALLGGMFLNIWIFFWNFVHQMELFV